MARFKRADPRKLPGSIGRGGPYDHGIPLEIEHAVLLEGVDVSTVQTQRGGIVTNNEAMALVLRGRVNKTPDQVEVMFLMDEDGAAALVTEILGLASRAGWSGDFVRRVHERMEGMPT